MKKKKLLLLIINSIIAVSLFTGTSFAQSNHPAAVIMGYYTQVPENSLTVEPYIVSILALNEVAHNRHLGDVKQFIQWYFSKLNYPDKNGLTGTIYVYVLEEGREISANRYDSVDGYAGLFLYLLHQYVVKSGDTEIVVNNWDKIEDIAYLLPKLQDKDGLTFALPDSQVKYLMDNCEVYGGLTAYIELRKIAGKKPSAYYNQVRSAVKRGIITKLYDPDKLMFCWAIENEDLSQSSWKPFYPDAFAQLFPIYYDILSEAPELKTRMWRLFYYKYADLAKAFPVEQRIMFELTRAKMEGK